MSIRKSWLTHCSLVYYPASTSPSFDTHLGKVNLPRFPSISPLPFCSFPLLLLLFLRNPENPRIFVSLGFLILIVYYYYYSFIFAFQSFYNIFSSIVLWWTSVAYSKSQISYYLNPVCPDTILVLVSFEKSHWCWFYFKLFLMSVFCALVSLSQKSNNKKFCTIYSTCYINCNPLPP